MPDDNDNGPKTEQRPPWGGSGRGMMDEQPPQQQPPQRQPPQRQPPQQAELAAPTRSAEEVAKQYQDRRNRSALGKILAQEQRRARARASAK